MPLIVGGKSCERCAKAVRKGAKGVRKKCERCAKGVRKVRKVSAKGAKAGAKATFRKFSKIA